MPILQISGVEQKINDKHEEALKVLHILNLTAAQKWVGY
jgi:hypothetical protein